MSLAVVSIMLALSSVGADQKPIPQDAARMERQRRERLDWERYLMQGSYDRVGRRNPKWDEPARRALEAAARNIMMQVDPVVTRAEVHGPAAQAVAAGCDDPLVAYVHAFSSPMPDDTATAEHERLLRVAAELIVASPYPPMDRALIRYTPLAYRIAGADLVGEERTAAERDLEAIIDLIGPSAAEDPRGDCWELAWTELIEDILRNHTRLSGSLRASLDWVDARLAPVEGARAIRLFIRGLTLTKLAWQARGSKFAPEVTDEQFRSFEDLLKQARAALREAYAINPDQPKVARIMIQVEIGIGQGDRQAVDLWFERAMRTDGTDFVACTLMLDWLEPKWHGDRDCKELLAFGKACTATKNWRNGIIMFNADSHFRRYNYMSWDDWCAYFKDPAVWTEMAGAFEEYLKHYPHNDGRRTQFATMCYWSGRFREADAQYRILGDRLTPWFVAPKSSPEQLRRYRDRSAAIVTGKKP